MTVLSHVLTGDSKNSPWISTTKYVSVARKYDSGYGIVAIDFRKVTSKKVYAPLEIPDNGFDTNEWARELAVRDQEWLVYQYIPQSAIKGFVK